MSASASLQSYWQLTKPTIILLVAVTGFAQMLADGSFLADPIKMTLVLAAIILSAGCANALNQFIDRDIDAIMDRTRRRRPLPMAQLTPGKAIIFALVLGIVSNFYLWFFVNPMSAMISIATILFYIFVYTLWLKRRHPYNIVIGGAAGATAPLIASAAASGEPSVLSWILFWIIFTWTPPHFWALALAVKDQYSKVKVPMLPNVYGDQRTRVEIVLYTLILLPLTLLPLWWKDLGFLYAIVAVVAWIYYAVETFKMWREPKIPRYKRLFWVSIFYLFIVFVGVGVDGVIRHVI